MSKPTAVSQRSILHLSWPILFELMMLYMIPAVDAYYLSLISTETVAAVSSILPIMGLSMVLFMPLTQAGSSLASQHLGAGSQDRATATCTYMLLLNLLLGFVISGSFVLSADLLPRIVGLSDSLGTIAASYTRTLGWGYLFLGLRVGCSGILSSRGHTLINMISAVLMNLLNFLFNACFVQGLLGAPILGAPGVALASCLAWIGAMLFSGLWVLGPLGFRPRLRAVGWSAREGMKSILSIAVPSTLEPLSFQLSQVMISRFLVQLGTLTMTTRAFVANITLLSLLWCSAFSAGTQIKVAYLIGGGDFEGAQKQMGIGLKIALGGATVICLILVLASDFFLGLFSSDPDVHRLGFRVLIVAMFLEWGRCLNILVGGALRASGDAAFVATVGVLSMWGIAASGAFALGIAWEWGLIGVWLAMLVDEHFRGWISLHRWRSGRWKTKTLYHRKGRTQPREANS